MRGLILALPVIALSVPAVAQTMGNMPGMNMPAMKMPTKPVAKPNAKGKAAIPAASKRRVAGVRSRSATKPRTRPAQPGMSGLDMRSGSAPNPRAAHDMADMPGMDMERGSTPPTSGQAQPMQGHDMRAMPGMSMGRPTQGHDMSTMPGMDMRQDAPPGSAAQLPTQGDDMSSMPGMDMSNEQAMPGMKMGPGGATKPAVGNVPPPPVPTDHAADLIYGSAAMQSSRSDLRAETGGQNFYQVMLNLGEYQFRNGGDGYRWDGQAWFGGDINRVFIKSEGEGAVRGGVETAEVQALYSHAIGPYWNLQGGIRYDFKPNPSRTYATIAIEGLAPNNFDVEGALFLSNKGDMLARVGGYYDQRITQRVILQPRVELNLAAQDVPENQIGSGLSNTELGLRLRYEVKREFAPYVGVSWDRRVSNTARLYRAAGENASTLSVVLGIRTWF